MSAADLVDAPVVPTLTWSERPPGIDDATVWQELATQAGVQRLSSDGRPLAVVPFTVLCDGRLFTGTAESWEAGGGGTLNCAVPVEREASAAAQRADADYC